MNLRSLPVDDLSELSRSKLHQELLKRSASGAASKRGSSSLLLMLLEVLGLLREESGTLEIGLLREGAGTLEEGAEDGGGAACFA